MTDAVKNDLNSTRAYLDGLLGYQLRRASAAMMADFAREFAPVEIRPVQFAVLSLIADNKGISQRELCRRLSVQKANMAPLVSELEGRGLIARDPALSDRRIHMLSLTAKGKRLLPVWRKLVARHEEAFSKALSASERDDLTRLLRKLWSTAGEVDGSPSGGGFSR